MAGSAITQDEANPVFRLATRVGKWAYLASNLVPRPSLLSKERGPGNEVDLASSGLLKKKLNFLV